MIISMIAALDKKRGIGRGGRLPWHLSTDIRRFKALTIGHHVIMGRKTFNSIGRPLPGRTNIVVTRKRSYQPEGVLVVHSIKDAIKTAKQNGETEAFIIGGGQLFTQALALADRLYLTHVHTESQADTFFPELSDQWSVISMEEVPEGEKDDFSTTLIVYKRIENSLLQDENSAVNES